MRCGTHRPVAHVPQPVEEVVLEPLLVLNRVAQPSRRAARQSFCCTLPLPLAGASMETAILLHPPSPVSRRFNRGSAGQMTVSPTAGSAA